MTVAQLIQAFQDLIEENEDAAYMDVRMQSLVWCSVTGAYVGSDEDGDPVVVIY